MTYLDLLRRATETSGSVACMGLDLIPSCIPESTGSIERDFTHFIEKVFGLMKSQGVMPGAFKPNIGYYQALDRPRESKYEGSKALNNILTLCEETFPHIPVILDSKRGDIARSSLNYAWEGYDSWGCAAITVSPYMGEDSVSPFWDNFSDQGRGIYILNRTSNPGSKSFQARMVGDQPLYMVVAEKIREWGEEYPGVGAVVGATSLEELGNIATYYGKSGIPLLIPGVGSQGGSAVATIEALKQAGYDIPLARINSSSGITHPWKQNPAPSDWAGKVVENLELLNKELSL